MPSTYHHSVWPAISYVSTLIISAELFETEFKSEHLRSGGEISQLFGNTRLMLGYSGRNHNSVHLSLWYSRMITSEDDYRAFYVAPITEKLRIRPDFQFDPIIAAEIESLRPFPSTFEMAYARCKASSISQKMVLTCVMGVASSPITGGIPRGNLFLPAVMIGDAAHGIPASCSPDDMNETISDAIALGRMIIERYDNDSAFAAIPMDFYDYRHSLWNWLPTAWADKWMTAHGFEKARYLGYWVKQSLPSHGPHEITQRELESKHSELVELRILRYKKEEGNRWEKLQERMANYRLRQLEYNRKPDSPPTEIVVRYLDSRNQKGLDTRKQPNQEKKQAPNDP